MPSEYVDLLLCERFHWSPDELYNADADTIERFLVMWEVETEVQAAKSKAGMHANVSSRHPRNR